MKHFKLAFVCTLGIATGATFASAAQTTAQKEAGHTTHSHKHGESCGHTAVKHESHVDYLHDGHLHGMEKGKQVEHKLAINSKNPAKENPVNHADSHKHGPSCGHEAIPHGDHSDYLVDGKLHHVHGSHCDEHGTLN
jgi:hypothetical protein